MHVYMYEEVLETALDGVAVRKEVGLVLSEGVVVYVGTVVLGAVDGFTVGPYIYAYVCTFTHTHTNHNITSIM